MPLNSYEIISIPRHLRYVVFVDSNYPADKLLDLLSQLSRIWGGRMTPIIPVNNNSLTNEWKDLFSRFDPDYILRTADVSDDFIISACYELGLNPNEILNIDEPTNRIEGIYVGYLMPALDVYYGGAATLLHGGDLWHFEHPLMPFYKLNYLLDDRFVLKQKNAGRHSLVNITKDNVGELNAIITAPGFINNNVLGCTNAYTATVRPDPLPRDFFELIICNEYNIQDLLYYWNKVLYSNSKKRITSMIITVEQLDQFLKDESFKKVLYSLPTLSHILHVLSFTIPEEQLKEIVGKLTDYSKNNRFELIPVPKFPFKILDSRPPYKYGYKESPSVQVIHSSRHLVFAPTFSFQTTPLNGYIKWFIDVYINELEGSRRSVKFPLRCDARHIGGTSGSRIHRGRGLSVEMNYEPAKASWRLDLPQFVTIFEQMVTRPKGINEREAKAVYSHCKYSDTSNRMRNFLGLFNYDFGYLEEFLYDKFWSDLFEELTNNTRTEGDVIKFEALVGKCVAVFDTAGGLKKREESFRNEENLRMGLQDTLQRLIDSKIFLPGFVIKCDSCSSNIWYSVTEISEQILCKGCSFTNNFKAELPIGYKLNHLIKNNIGQRSEEGKFQPDGNLTVIRTLLSLQQKSSGNFHFAPSMDVFLRYHDPKPFTDLDIICLQNGKLVIGESKFNSEAFFGDNRKSLDKLIQIAETTKPDILILSCTVDTADKLDKAGKYLKHFIRKWPSGGPEVITYKTWEPTYFNLDGRSYFRY